LQLPAIDRDSAVLALEARVKALVLRRHSGICALASFSVNDAPGEPDKVHINLQWSSSALYNSVKSWVDRTFAGIMVPRGGETCSILPSVVDADCHRTAGGLVKSTVGCLLVLSSDRLFFFVVGGVGFETIIFLQC
jgi:hypothetical protein